MRDGQNMEKEMFRSGKMCLDNKPSLQLCLKIQPLFLLAPVIDLKTGHISGRTSCVCQVPHANKNKLLKWENISSSWGSPRQGALQGVWRHSPPSTHLILHFDSGDKFSPPTSHKIAKSSHIPMTRNTPYHLSEGFCKSSMRPRQRSPPPPHSARARPKPCSKLRPQQSHPLLSPGKPLQGGFQNPGIPHPAPASCQPENGCPPGLPAATVASAQWISTTVCFTGNFGSS